MDLTKTSLFEDGHLGDVGTGLYVDALLNKELANLDADVRFHVQECPACKDKILEIYSFLNDTKRLEKPFPMPGFLKEAAGRSKPGILPGYLKRMAAIFFFVAIFLGAYFWMLQDGMLREGVNPLPGDRTQQDVSATSGKMDNEGIQAAPIHVVPKMTKPVPEGVKRNFRINRNLEYMIGSNYRSKSVEVMTPANGETLEGRIHFSWKALSKDALLLKILNNRNETLYTYPIDSDKERTVFEFEERLKPGLYYWKLESGVDLVHVGKFIRGASTSPKE